MKIYIDPKFQNSTDEQLVEAVEQSCGGYHEEAEGREYYYEADGATLKQIYSDDEHGDDTVEWAVGGSQIDKLSGNLEIEFHS